MMFLVSQVRLDLMRRVSLVEKKEWLVSPSEMKGQVSRAQFKELEKGCWVGLVELKESLAVTSKSLRGVS